MTPSPTVQKSLCHKYSGLCLCLRFLRQLHSGIEISFTVCIAVSSDGHPFPRIFVEELCHAAHLITPRLALAKPAA